MKRIQFNAAKPKMAIIEKQLKDSLYLTFTKLALHIKEPENYPLPTGKNNIEHYLKNVYAKLNKTEKDTLLKRFTNEPNLSTKEGKRKWGALSAVELNSNKSILVQTNELLNGQDLKFNAAEKLDLENTFGLTKHKRQSTFKHPQPQQAGGGPRNLRLSIEKVKCIDTQDLHKDEISVKGFTVSAILEEELIEELSLGKFKVADNIIVNKTLRDFDLREANGFPQTFLVSLFVIERDTKKDDATLERTIDISQRVSIVALAVGQFAAPFAIGAILLTLPGLNIAALTIAIVSLALGILIEILGDVIPSLRKSEVSQELQDIFVFDLDVLGAGESVSNTFNAELTGTNALKLKGNYDITFKWQRVD